MPSRCVVDGRSESFVNDAGYTPVVEYRSLSPHPDLFSTVECVWFARGPAIPRRMERILPDGCVELIVHLGEPFRRRLDACFELQPSAFVVGPFTSALLVAPPETVATMGVRLRPGWAGAVLGAPASALTDSVARFEEIWGRAGSLFDEELRGKSTDQERAGLALHFLRRRLSGRHRGEDSIVTTAVRSMLSRHERLRVTSLARALGISRRQLERRFVAAVGLPPRSFARLARFQRALHLRARGQAAGWADLAQAAGYADQAHFIREFRAFAGTTPEAYAREERDLAGQFVTGERLDDFFGAGDAFVQSPAPAGR